MKKIILTSLVLASTAAIADMTDPLFMPRAGGIVSETDFNYIRVSSNHDTDAYMFTEKMSYGISDKMAISGKIGIGSVDIKGDDDWEFSTFDLGARYRIALTGGMMLDLFGTVKMDLDNNSPIGTPFFNGSTGIEFGAMAGKNMGALTSTGFISMAYDFNRDSDGDDWFNLALGTKNQYRFTPTFSMNGDLALGWYDLTEQLGDRALFINATIGAGFTMTQNMLLSVYGGYEYIDADVDTKIIGGIKFGAQF